MKKPLIYFSLLIIVGLVVGAYFFNNFSIDSNSGGEVGGQTEATNLSPTGADSVDNNVEVVDYTLDLQNFSFSPNLIEAEAGETIRVKIINKQGFHDFVVDELGVRSSQISQGQEEIIEIKIPIDATGQEYEFYCSVGNHRAQGMVGVIKVK